MSGKTWGPCGAELSAPAVPVRCPLTAVAALGERETQNSTEKKLT